MYEIVSKNKIRYTLQVESPVIILPINQTFHGKKAAVWILRTGNVKIETEDLEKVSSTKGVFYNGLRENECYDGYRVQWDGIGLRYFKSFEYYEKQVKQRQRELQNAFQQNLPLTATEEKVHSAREFVVLEDFQITMLLKVLRAKTDPEQKMTKLEVEVEQSPISINFNHLTYNHLLNISRVFEISKQK